ncbi:Polypyrimidine tract-binding protein-like 1 [Vitis vinifera]|uniref:Polypyrimidine tract-binding protein-like 1 n=1 Tax=Vitis vinifera TaxID=29760 RepID=A0A438FI93_VITVI|nr:Polypyrimidine tract-binding protein-like 1 [Vitis vinifera]
MSTSGQPQFRYTQTPSKVLHLRNLPWECTEEELVELCKPFGKIVNTKCNVGANRNQAFVEFLGFLNGKRLMFRGSAVTWIRLDLNQAISMVSYYASSSEPAQVRGKTVYIQYSNRHEIVNNKSPGDVPGNVLLVTIEGVEAGDVSIDVIHLVFSAFGFVHKIATFEKAAGFQALIQFTDAETASSARNALDGRSIPGMHSIFCIYCQNMLVHVTCVSHILHTQI